MLHYWQKEVESLKKSLLNLGAIVEEQIQKAILSLSKRDSQLAESVINKDREIDLIEIDVEEECLKILALYQPVAKDLRFVIAALKMNIDLERIGDLAANIASRSLYLSKREKIDLIEDLIFISGKAQIMVKKSLDSLINLDVHTAIEVLKADDEVDDLTKDMLNKIISAIENDPSRTRDYFGVQSISKNLERMADAATNIAEDVVYLCTGEIIRHKGESFHPNES